MGGNGLLVLPVEHRIQAITVPDNRVSEPYSPCTGSKTKLSVHRHGGLSEGVAITRGFVLHHGGGGARLTSAGLLSVFSVAWYMFT